MKEISKEFADILTVVIVVAAVAVAANFLEGSMGFELRASLLLGRHSTTRASLPVLFCVGYFQDRILRIISLGWL
jgi:hypothetical protein